ALHALPLAAGDRDDGSRDRIGADGHAADRCWQWIAEQFEHPVRDQVRAPRIERDLAAIEVVVRFLAGGEREVAHLQGLLANEIHEGGLVEHAVAFEDGALEIVGWIITNANFRAAMSRLPRTTETT